jgi:hypothetical protein
MGKGRGKRSARRHAKQIKLHAQNVEQEHDQQDKYKGDPEAGMQQARDTQDQEEEQNKYFRYFKQFLYWLSSPVRWF